LAVNNSRFLILPCDDGMIAPERASRLTDVAILRHDRAFRAATVEHRITVFASPDSLFMPIVQRRLPASWYYRLIRLSFHLALEIGFRI
jgi:hypothetical protein